MDAERMDRIHSVERYRQERSMKQESHSRSRSRSPVRNSRCSIPRITISNIPYEMTWEKIKKLIKDEVGYTGYVEMVLSNGKPVGMAVVEFKTVEVASQAVSKLNRYPIGDRKLVVREESDRDRERIAQYKSNVNSEDLIDLMDYLAPMIMEKMDMEGPATNSVHVSNIDFSAAWQEVKDLFRLAGQVINVEIKEDADGKSRGFGLVKYSAAYEAVQSVFMLNGQMFHNRPLRVKIDREGDLPRRLPRERLMELEAQAVELLPFVLAQVTSGASRNVKALAQALRLRSIPEGAKTVGSGFGSNGLPLRGGHDIGLWIQGILRENAVPPAHSRGGSRYDAPRMGGGAAPMYDVEPRRPPPVPVNTEAIASLRALISAAAAGGMREDQILDAATTIGLQDIVRNAALPGGKVPPRAGPPPYAGGRGSMEDHYHDRRPTSGSRSGGGGGGGAARAPPSNGRQTNSGSYAVVTGTGGVKNPKTVIVKNLPFSYNWEDLYRSFNEVANVRTAEVRVDANKKSKGFGYVHFYSPEDAKKAVEAMNGVRFDGREIVVEQC